MFKSVLTKKFISFLILSILFIPFLVQADSPTDNTTDILDNLKKTGVGTDSVTEFSLIETVGDIIILILGFLGIILVILIIWAGFKWMTAGGDSKKVDDAKALIKNAVIGTIIILAAYTITVFVITKINDAVSGNRIVS